MTLRRRHTERADTPPLSWEPFSDGVGYKDHAWALTSRNQQLIIISLGRGFTLLPTDQVRKILRQLDDRNLVTQARDGLTPRGAELAAWAERRGYAQPLLDAASEGQG